MSPPDVSPRASGPATGVSGFAFHRRARLSPSERRGGAGIRGEAAADIAFAGAMYAVVPTASVGPRVRPKGATTLTPVSRGTRRRARRRPRRRVSSRAAAVRRPRHSSSPRRMGSPSYGPLTAGRCGSPAPAAGRRVTARGRSGIGVRVRFAERTALTGPGGQDGGDGNRARGRLVTVHRRSARHAPARDRSVVTQLLDVARAFALGPTGAVRLWFCTM